MRFCKLSALVCFFPVVAFMLSASLDAKHVYSDDIMERIYAIITTPKPNSHSACTEALINMALLGDSSMALSFFLFSSKALNDLGNYDDCVESSARRFITLDFRNLPIAITFGFCLPAACTADYFFEYRAPLVTLMNSIVDQLKGNYAMKLEIKEKDVYFIDPVKETQENKKFGAGFIVLTTIIGVFVLLCCIVTGLEIVGRLKGEPSSGLGAAVRAFGLKKSWNDFVSNRRKGDYELAYLDGIRVLCIVWIIYGHVFYVAKTVPAVNPQGIQKLTVDPTKTFLYNATLSVDVFLYLSAFLFTYIFLSRSKGSPKLHIMIYIHRLIRLYPMLLLALGVFCFITPVISDGPIYYRIYQMVNEYCGQIWYMVLLFASNFRRLEQNCLDYTWYVAIDFQLFLVAPFIVFLYSKKKLLGVIVPLIIIVGCAIGTIIVAFKYDVWASMNKYNKDYEEKYYERPYTRAGSYMLGILAGYFFYEHKEGKLTKFTNFVKNNTVVHWVCYIVAAGGMVCIIQALYFINKELPPRALDLLYLLFSRLVFISLLFLLSLPILVGKGPWLSALLGNHVFFVLGKLGYGAYLMHKIPMQYFAFITRRGIHFGFAHLSMLSWGYILLAHLLSLFCFLFIEQPIFSLEQRFLLKRKAKKTVEEDESTLVKDTKEG